MGNLIRKLLWTGVIVAILLLLAPALRRAFHFVQLMRQEPPRTLALPVVGVDRGNVSDSWGNPRSGGRRHEGIDIFAPKDTPVLSTTRGVVLRCSSNNLGGLFVTVLGPGGQTHYYAHLARHARLSPWQWVQPGDVLGFVGNTGNAKGGPHHLHYGIYSATGEAVNPFPFLKTRKDDAGTVSSAGAGGITAAPRPRHR